MLPAKLSWKIISLNTAMVFNLSKKDPATGHVLRTKLSFKSFQKYLRQIVCTVFPLLQLLLELVLIKTTIQCVIKANGKECKVNEKEVLCYEIEFAMNIVQGF